MSSPQFYTFTHSVKLVLDNFKNGCYTFTVDVWYAGDDLSLLELEAEFTAGFSQPIVRAFRKRMQQIRAALDERDFYKLKSLRFEKLGGKRKHQHSMRLNDQYRLIVELIERNPGEQGSKIVKIVGIEDYH